MSAGGNGIEINCFRVRKYDVLKIFVYLFALEDFYVNLDKLECSRDIWYIYMHNVCAFYITGK